MRRSLTALGATVTLLALAACSGGGSGGDGESPAAEGEASTLVLGATQFPTSFGVDGYYTAAQVQYFNAVFDTLVRQDGTGGLVPGLATDWTYDDARTTLTLTLRDGVTFTDGTAFDADVVVQNIEHFQASATADLANAQYITGVEAPDASTVVISLSEPDPQLTVWLTGALGYMASPDSWDDQDVATNPVGTGPYTLDTDRTVVGSSYVFEKNPEYWDDSYTVYDTLTINYYETSAALLNALQGGQLDAAPFSDFASIAQVEAAGYEVISSQLDWMGLLLMDREGSVDAPLADVKVRQAINYAFDREGILEAIGMGRGTVTSSVFGESTAGYDAALDDYYSYDPDKARSLLAEAGYPDGFALEMPTASSLNQSLITTMQQQLGEVGITVSFTDAGTNFVTDLIAGKYSASWMQLAASRDWQLAQLGFTPSAVFNPFKNETPELDEYLAVMQAGMEDEAAAAAKEANTYLVENAWFAPLYRIDNVMVAKSSVDVTMAADNAGPYLYLIQPAS